MKLAEAPPSRNCHKVRMMLSSLGLDYEKLPIALPNQEQKSSEHLARHPLGKVPAREDEEVTVWDSQAILVYLSGKFNSSNTWLPADPVGQEYVTQWLFFTAKELCNGPSADKFALVSHQSISPRRASTIGCPLWS